MIESGCYDVNQLDKEGISLLHWAAINNRLQIVRYLLMKGSIVDRLCGDLNTNALQWAIRQGHLQMVVLLIHYGSNPLVTDINGWFLYLSIPACNRMTLFFVMDAMVQRRSIVSCLSSQPTWAV